MTPVLRDTKRHIALSIKEKEKQVYEIAFLSPSKSDFCEPIVIPKVAHQIVIKDVIYKALMNQLISKNPRFDKIKFCILRMV